MTSTSTTPPVDEHVSEAEHYLDRAEDAVTVDDLAALRPAARAELLLRFAEMHPRIAEQTRRASAQPIRMGRSRRNPADAR